MNNGELGLTAQTLQNDLKLCYLHQRSSMVTQTYLTSDDPEEDDGLCVTSCLSGIRNPAMLKRSRIM